MKLLIINPGSTSTKIAVFEDETSILDKTIRHELAELEPYERLADEYDFRKDIIMKTLTESGHDLFDFDAIVGRGGLVKPIDGGTYEVNDAMICDLKTGIQGEHASNLGGLIAHEIAKHIGKKAFIVDPVVVDELQDIARISGHPMVKRRSIFHALNQKAMVRRYCKDNDKQYKYVTVIVAHMGGGISVGLHHKGRVIDVNNALDGDGPFSPERSGGLPIGDLATICFNGNITQREIKQAITGKGGMVAYFGTNNMIELAEKSKTDSNIRLHIDAMIYQIAKEIAALSSVVCGKVEAIILTGGLAYWDYLVKGITERVKFIADISVYPGEHELIALAQGALRVLRGEEEALIYK